MVRFVVPLAALLAALRETSAFGLVQPHNSIYGSSTVAAKTSATQLFAEGSEILMPALSSTMKEGKVVSWLKNEGDEIEAGEAIMVVESDKADMDVEAFEDGYLAKILVGEGEMAPVGQAVALVAASEADIEAVAAGGGAAAAAPAAEAAAPAGGESSLVVSSSSIESTEIFMPALSSTMSEGKVVEWLKNVGDYVEAGEALMVVESDKADMDVEAFEDGYLAAIIKGEGETADVGAPVGILVPNEADVAAWSSSSNPVSSSSSSPTVTTEPSTGAPAAGPPDVEFSQIDMPALSSTMKEGKVVAWLKAEGDPISSGEAIMVVESDKADMDVEAFDDGFLAAIITEEGDSGAVGAPVALIATEEKDIPVLKAYAATLGGAPAAAAPAAAAPAAAAAAAPKKMTTSKAASGERVVASPLAKKKAEELGVDISTVAGTGPEGRITASDVEAAASGAPAAKAAPAGKAAAPAKPSWTPAAGVVAATPMARAAAKKAKLDLASIQGTGQFGRVTIDDVKMATGEKAPERKRATSAGEAAADLPDGFVPFSGMQKAVSKNMDATLTVPAFQVSTDIIMDDFEALYKKVKPDGISVSALLAKAVAIAIERHPIMNSAYSAQEGGGFMYKKDINIAMAVAINGGLITPNIMYANERSVKEIAEEWQELVGKAKTGSLSAPEYTSGTFTISNMGMFGVTNFGSLLPVGQGGILAIGATQDVIVPDAAAILGMKRARKMSITLTCDHRHIYGSDAALFLKTLKSIMENELDKVGK
jgi:pyruvate dehydrogenase E2 component (dihydrolipoamide acetyltransferase)